MDAGQEIPKLMTMTASKISSVKITPIKCFCFADHVTLQSITSTKEMQPTK